MTRHIDIVDNDWKAGVQRRVACVFELEDLLAKLDGSYRFSTSPHDDADCPFRDGNEVPMKVIEVDPLTKFILAGQDLQDQEVPY